MILTAPMKTVIVFKKIYLLLSILKISVLIPSSVNNANKNLLVMLIYWLTKYHKSPTKARHITAAQGSSAKPLSKSAIFVFKLFFKQIELQQTKLFLFWYYFFTIFNNKPVVNSVINLNNSTKASSIPYFDFSTLYSKILYNKLIKELNELIDFKFT